MAIHTYRCLHSRQNSLNESQASSDKVTQMAQAEVSSLRAITNGLAEKLRLININPNSKLSTNKILFFIFKSLCVYAND